MSDLRKYVAKRKKTDKEFAAGFDEGYEQLKLSAASCGESLILKEREQLRIRSLPNSTGPIFQP